MLNALCIEWYVALMSSQAVTTVRIYTYVAPRVAKADERNCTPAFLKLAAMTWAVVKRIGSVLLV